MAGGWVQSVACGFRVRLVVQLFRLEGVFLVSGGVCMQKQLWTMSCPLAPQAFVSSTLNNYLVGCPSTSGVGRTCNLGRSDVQPTPFAQDEREVGAGRVSFIAWTTGWRA